jgi:putative molybdopterin biosynthesis protein
MNKLYTAQEIADKLQIKKTTVYELIKRGELYSSKVGKQLRISDQQLQQYLQRSDQTFSHPEGSAAHTEISQRNPLQVPELPPESSLLKRDYLLHSNGLILCGQFSPALELLVSQMSIHPQGIPVLQSYMNSYNSLYSLYFKKAHIACASLDLEDIRHLVPGTALSLLCLYEYTLGLYVPSENPQNLSNLEDFCSKGIKIANREKGSTPRIYLDRFLSRHQIPANSIPGYNTELVSDISAAAAITSHKVDAVLGEEYAARQSGAFDFVPLETLPMYLIMETQSLKQPGFQALLDIVRSEDFRNILQGQTGYNINRTGELFSI